MIIDISLVNVKKLFHCKFGENGKPQALMEGMFRVL